MEPITVKVRTTWQGKVGVHDKYISQALKEGRGLVIHVGPDTMELTKEEVGKKNVGKSDRPFLDRFTRNRYWLIYYRWEPQNVQGTLL